MFVVYNNTELDLKKKEKNDKVNNRYIVSRTLYDMNVTVMVYN